MIEKRLSIDKIEIIGDNRIIQVRLKAEIIEDGVVLGKIQNVRLSPKCPVEDITDHKDVNIGGIKVPVPTTIKDELLGISEKVWTKDIVDKYKAEKGQVIGD